MPELDWNVFAGLPGAETNNFELLCRALIRRHYEKFGRFAALANQPGVEFHIKLDKQCSLGDPGDWFGWQCRWYDLPSGKAIGKTRKSKILQAIQTTEKHLPDLTHWVLWTRNPLTKGDQAWFDRILTKLTLVQWTSSEVEAHLSGEAAILRGTYFGELVLTPETLSMNHEKALAPVKARWQPEVHQIVEAEKMLRAPLGEMSAWQTLNTTKSILQVEVGLIESGLKKSPKVLQDHIKQLIKLGRLVETQIERVLKLLKIGDLEVLLTELSRPSESFQPELLELPRRLRSARSQLSLSATNIIAHIELLDEELDKLAHYISLPLVAVVAEAGNGKTELAVALTVPQVNRPSGILLHGINLAAKGKLDDLANSVTIQGLPCPSMEALIAALNAAAERAECRLPLVIDALNEAEDPRDWKPLLATLSVILKGNPNVFVICTVRPDFTKDSLPEDTESLTLPGFGLNTSEAIRRYFEYYKIKSGDARFHLELLSHPLTLRLYCEVTNPNRSEDVTLEGMPRTLSDLFDRYLIQVADRIAELSSATYRVHADDVKRAFFQLGLELWITCDRAFDKEKLRDQLDGVNGRWENSMVRALVSNRVLLDAPGHNDVAKPRMTILYDRLAGHLIGDALLKNHGEAGFAAWLKSNDARALTSDTDQHPLANDILASLIMLTPRRFKGQQLWKLVDEPTYSKALIGTLKLEGHLIDTETVEALADYISKNPNGIPNLFEDLEESRAIASHPLNVHFLDQILRPMSVVQRDLSWTEWVGNNRHRIVDWIEQVEIRWINQSELDETDDLTSLWMFWLLTSNARKVRDLATRALNWYGQKRTEHFISLSSQMFLANDPYVVERTVAALLGVVFSLRNAAKEHVFVKTHLPNLAREVYSFFFTENAPAATTHILTHNYACKIIYFAEKSAQNLFSKQELHRVFDSYPQDLKRSWGRSSDLDKGQYRNGDSPLGHDFENYTLGFLIPNRRNYDYNHPEFQVVKEQLFWRLYNLGYTLEAFSKLDQSIVRRDYSGREEDGHKVERFGKKYCWIAYHELAGLRMCDGQLGDTVVGDFVDIDPSFSTNLRSSEHIKKRFLGNTEDTQEWILKKDIPSISTYLSMKEVDKEDGPWIMLNGNIRQDDERLGRGIKIHIRSMLVKVNEVEDVRFYLADQTALVNWWPKCPEYHKVYGGDLPPKFEEDCKQELLFRVNEGKKIVQEEITAFHRNDEPISDLELTELIDISQRAQDLESDAEAKRQAAERAIEEAMVAREIKISTVSRSSEQEAIREVSFDVIVPVMEGTWSADKSSANEGWSATVPAINLTEQLDLEQRPHSFDYQDSQGNLASLFRSYDGDKPYLEYQEFTYLRASLLRKYLEENKLQVLWLVTGERCRSNDVFQKRQGKHDSDFVYYKGFEGTIEPDEESGTR